MDALSNLNDAEQISLWSERVKFSAVSLVCGSFFVIFLFLTDIVSVSLGLFGILVGLAGCNAASNFSVHSASCHFGSLFFLTLAYVIIDIYTLSITFTDGGRKQLDEFCKKQQDISATACKSQVIGLRIFLLLTHLLGCGSCTWTAHRYYKKLSSTSISIDIIPQLIAQHGGFINNIVPTPEVTVQVDLSRKHSIPPPKYAQDGQWTDQSIMIDSNMMAIPYFYEDDPEKGYLLGYGPDTPHSNRSSLDNISSSDSPSPSSSNRESIENINSDSNNPLSFTNDDKTSTHSLNPPISTSSQLEEVAPPIDTEAPPITSQSGSLDSSEYSQTISNQTTDEPPLTTQESSNPTRQVDSQA